MSIKTSESSIKNCVKTKLNDVFMRQSIANAQDLLNQKRENCFEDLGHYEKWREMASDIRIHVLDNLDYYLDLFVTRAGENGAQIHFAQKDQEANQIAQNIFKQKKAKRAVKSKSMVTEEIGLNDALEDIGAQVVETDLGEYLLQIDKKDKPSHIVVPALHKSRERIQKVLSEQKGYQGDNVPENMTRFVRKLLREEYLNADIGITGCNFAIAETGSIALMTNEGNGRFVTTVPKTQIVFMGMERIVPSFKELDILFSMLSRSAVGSRTTVYMSLLTGPRRIDDVDGPEEMHIIIVDNGRSDVLASQFRDVLKCIRCGTCMLECPAYRHISGHGYGALYPGPLGAALVPILAGYENFKDITKICSLCGACNDVCPVKIPLYETIFEHRRIIAQDKKLNSSVDNLVFSQYGNIIGNSKLYNFVTKMAFMGNFAPKVGPLQAWGKSRKRPIFPNKRFRDWYKNNKEEKK